MTNFTMPNKVTALPMEQQEAIRRILKETHLLDTSGKPKNLTAADMPEKHKAALGILGLENLNLDFDIGCAAARIGEAAAIVACASVPGGQIAVAACVAAAHEAANAACR